MVSNTQTVPDTGVRHDSRKNAESADALMFKKRMLQWLNPVEYVNNMYGCHPGDGDTEYFYVVFGE